MMIITRHCPTWFLLVTLPIAHLVGCTNEVSVSGSVNDLVRGSGIAGATVRITGGEELESVETSADGTFTFQKVPEGTYQITVEQSGYTLASANTVIDSETTSLPAVELAVLQEPGVLGAFGVGSHDYVKIPTFKYVRERYWAGFAGTENRPTSKAPALSPSTKILIHDTTPVSDTTFELVAGLTTNRYGYWECGGNTSSLSVRQLAPDYYIVDPGANLSTGGYCLWNDAQWRAYIFRVE